MKIKPVITRRQADADTDTAFDFYLNESGVETAIAFIDELEKGYHHIARHPLTGSTRYADEMMLSGMRQWPMKSFPYLIFYLEKEKHVEIARALHTSVDISSRLEDDDVE